MKSFSRIGYVVVLMANYPHASHVETHAFQAGTVAQNKVHVKKVLSGWMQGKDKMVQLESADASHRKIITPFVIETEDGEDCDIFAQLIIGG